jgi:chorismate mutase
LPRGLYAGSARNSEGVGKKKRRGVKLVSEEEFQKMIEALRSEIDEANAEIARALAKRFMAVLQIGEAKIKAGKPVFDPAREAVVLEKTREAALREGMSDSEAKAAVEVMRKIMDESKRLQEERMQ